MNDYEVFVINLDKNKDRLDSFDKTMKELDIKYERYPAVLGSLYKPKYLTPGEYGCFMSHRNIWKKIVDENLEAAVVFEDDISLSTKYSVEYAKKIMNDKYQDIKNGLYNIFYLGKCLDRCDCHIRCGENIVKTFKPLCSQAYIINNKTARILIDKCQDVMEMNIPVDVFISGLIKNLTLNSYAMHPSLFVQNINLKSDLRRGFLEKLNVKECAIPYYFSSIVLLLIIVIVIFILIYIFF